MRSRSVAGVLGVCALVVGILAGSPPAQAKNGDTHSSSTGAASSA